MPRGRAKGYDDQRELILTRAATLFALRGYPGTSMNEVAQACGLSKATLYHYYRDKSHLLFDTVDSYLDTLIGIVAEVSAQELSPTEHLSALVARFMRFRSVRMSEACW